MINQVLGSKREIIRDTRGISGNWVKRTKMALHGQKGLELIGRAFWSLDFLEIG